MLTIGSSGFYNAHHLELQNFVNCLIRDKQPTPTGEDGLKDIETIEQAYKTNTPKLDYIFNAIPVTLE